MTRGEQITKTTKKDKIRDGMGLMSRIPCLLLLFFKQRRICITKLLAICVIMQERLILVTAKHQINTNISLVSASDAANTKRLSDGTHMSAQTTVTTSHRETTPSHWCENRNGIPLPLVYLPVTAPACRLGSEGTFKSLRHDSPGKSLVFYVRCSPTQFFVPQYAKQRQLSQ
jgi:hypothetical protein